MHPPATTKAFVGPSSGVPKKFSPQFKARAVALLADGKNATEVAAELGGVSVTTVAEWAKALKIALPVGRAPGSPPTRFSEHRDAILACYAAGDSQADAVRKLGLSRQLVHKHWPKEPKPA